MMEQVLMIMCIPVRGNSVTCNHSSDSWWVCIHDTGRISGRRVTRVLSGVISGKRNLTMVWVQDKARRGTTTMKVRTDSISKTKKKLFNVAGSFLFQNLGKAFLWPLYIDYYTYWPSYLPSWPGFARWQVGRELGERSISEMGNFWSFIINIKKSETPLSMFIELICPFLCSSLELPSVQRIFG